MPTYSLDVNGKTYDIESDSPLSDADLAEYAKKIGTPSEMDLGALPSIVPGEAQEPSVTPAQATVGPATALGRGMASLADVTVGGVLPAIAQQLAYPLARIGRTPEEAQAATQRIVGAVEKPFGKAFGVTESPEYQQEAGRQLFDFIGQNFQKGAKWISEKTGLPASDVENILGTLSVAAPAIVKPVAEAISPVLQDVRAGVTLPFEQRIQASLEKKSARDYARGPQIDAAAEAQRLGIALNPTDIQPTIGPRITSTIAGEKGILAINQANKNQIRKVAIQEMDLPSTTQLDGKDAFNQARNKLAAPYTEVTKLPTMMADDATRSALNNLRPDETLIGSDKYARSINSIIDDASSKIEAGLTGAELLKNVRTLRQRARKTYDNKSADLAALDLADTNLAIANVLESMIESNITNPKLLGEFRDARQKMARTYAYEAATDMNTGMVDVKKISRITAKDNALTGDIASLGKIAGNFPEAFSTQAALPWNKNIPAIGRTGAAGSLGGVAGYALGQDYVSAVLGGLGGALTGRLMESAAARRIASPEYQAGLQLQDMRIPPPAQMMAPIPQSQAVVPYQAPAEVLMPGEGPYQPNFVMRPGGYGPVTTPGVAPGPAQIGMAEGPVGGQMGALRMEDIRARDLSMSQGAAAEAQQAAAAAASRQPTGRGSVLEFDPITGTYKVGGEGVKGATPEVFMSDTGASLSSAAEKIAANKRFDMTAAEKVAWNKTRIELARALPELKSLSDKAISSKMMDREWVNDTITKINDRAIAFDEIAKRAATRQAAFENAKKRDQMFDILSSLEDSLRPARPVSSDIQGRKTREFNRNQLNANIAKKSQE